MLKKVALLFLFLIISLTSTSQVSECKCSLLKYSEENSEKVIALGELIENAFNESNTKPFVENFNKEAFNKNITKDSLIDSNDMYTRRFLKSLENTSNTLGERILSEIEDGAYYNFINFEFNIPESAYYMTFRIYSEETGVNYHDYKICYDGENVMYNDIYIYLTGEHLSETFGRIYKASKPSKNKFVKLFKGEKKHPFSKVIKAQQLLKEGKPKEAYETITEVKGKNAEEKFFLILKGNIAAAYDDNLYKENLEIFAKLYPDDPTLYMKQIDYYILIGNYIRAIENIDKLMFETDDDFLNIMKANLYLNQTDYKNADIHYSYMIENYPFLVEGYIGHISSLTYQERYSDAVNVINTLTKQGFDKNELSDFLESDDEQGINVLEALVLSDEYKAWKKS
ncbi:M48 family metallopeptidase [uncultured Winogradskyella sp.]|uniref:tetratricopeptide repeat protein n=1 Tax=uncultured Winogradskyella sp. TaxID=395353 RepID=UPI00263922DA|nr:hypothetical protein [uncultured Winogradskyella sp.]